MRLIEQSQPGNELGSEDIHLISCKQDRRVGSIAELSQHQVSTISKAFSKSLRVVTTWPVFIDKLDRVVEIMEIWSELDKTESCLNSSISATKRIRYQDAVVHAEPAVHA